ncbi:protease III [Klebsiella pneumoniae]|uniref:Protease III n=1 Tax=Klebsiella pneumoniae TaxID=573 RepID=A0A377V8H4_KLEPN|nr:protease III [Klebsiella pneumoniae]
MARTRDGMRMAQVSAETINPAHPAAHFSGGNLETLSDKPGSPVLDALHTFRDSWYSANLMKAVIYSNKPVAGAGAHGCGHLWPRAESSDQQAGNYRPGGHGCAKRHHYSLCAGDAA